MAKCSLSLPSWAPWAHLPSQPPGRWRQKDYKVQANLGDLARLGVKIKTQKAWGVAQW